MNATQLYDLVDSKLPEDDEKAAKTLEDLIVLLEVKFEELRMGKR